MKNAEVAAAFVARKQPHARNSDRSFYFEGDRLYSYGSHYVLARWDGARLLLSIQPAPLNDSTNSRATPAHRSELRMAASAAKVEYNCVHDADRTLVQELEFMVECRTESLTQALRRIRRPKHASRFIQHLTYWDRAWIKEFSEKFNLSMPKLTPWPPELVVLKAECIFRGYL